MIEEAGQTVGISSTKINGWWLLGDARMGIAAVPLVLLFTLIASGCTPQPENEETQSVSASIADPHGQASIDRKIRDLESETQQTQDHRTWSALAVLYGFEGRLGDAREAAKQAVALGADERTLAARIERAHNEGEL